MWMQKLIQERFQGLNLVPWARNPIEEEALGFIPCPTSSNPIKEKVQDSTLSVLKAKKRYFKSKVSSQNK